MASEEYVDPTGDNSSQTVEQAEPSKEEVGWMFVHQYYTILNKEPQILYRFYTKNSTLCHGDEGESVMPSVGQIEIHKKIKQLDFQDCKVLVSNVDSQSAADGGIVVQVLGELSNKGHPSQKFVQTFCLAPQAKGYYVHNDIFRYLKEDTGTSYDNEEPARQASPPAPVISAAPSAAAPPSSQGPSSATIQDKDQPQTSAKDSSLFADKIGEEKAAAAQKAAAAEKAAAQVTEQPPKEPVKTPQPPPTTASAPVTAEPSSTTSAASSTTPSATATPAQAEAKPATSKESAAPPAVPAPEQVESVSKAPTSWAALAAKNRAAEKISIAPENAVAAATAAAAAAAASNNTAVAPPSTSQGSTATPNGAPASAATPAATKQQQQQQTGGEGAFQQANGKGPAEEKKRRRGPINFSELHSAYIKHVTDKVDEGLLREALEKFGKLDHFEVSRAKNCAFVDFATAGALKAALDQNSVRVGSETVSVQERRRGGALQKNQSSGRGGQYNNTNNNNNNPTTNVDRKGGPGGGGNRPPRNPNRNKRVPTQTE